MGFVAAKCPNCGATVDLSEDREFGFCTYCGTKIIQDKVVIEHRGKVSVDGIANVSTVLDRAYLFIEDGKFTEASTYLEKALDINPRCSKAYLGKLLCQYQLSNIDRLKESALPVSSNEFFNKAIRFASPAELNELEQIKAQIRNNMLQVGKNLQKAADDINERIDTTNDYLKTNLKKYRVSQTISVVLTIISIVVIVGILLFALAALLISDSNGSKIMGWLTLVLVAIEVGLILFRRKLKKQRKVYDDAKTSIGPLQSQLIAAKQKCESWENQAR